MYPVLLTAFASMSTSLGGVTAALFKNINKKALSFSQGFAAGVMITISFLDMLPLCYENALEYMPKGYATAGLIGLFMSGWVISALMESFFSDDGLTAYSESRYTKKLIAVTTAVLILHNLPEGMLTVFSAKENPRFGLHMAVAMALHNIPEGIAVSVPVMYLENKPIKAFLTSLFVGAAEFIGGFLTYIIFYKVIDQRFVISSLGIICGIMVQTSLCSLIPSGVKFSGFKYTFYGAISAFVIIYLGIFII